MKVKILGISCAYKNEPDVPWLVQYALKAAEKFGRRIKELIQIETEIVDLADREIKSCADCRRFCIPGRVRDGDVSGVLQDSGCIIKDDYMAELMPKIAAADGFVFGSSVTNRSYSIKFGLLAERLTAARYKGYLTGKPVTSIASGYEARAGGQELCMNQMGAIMASLEMIRTGWAIGSFIVSGPPYEGRKDYFGLRVTVLGGRKVAELAVLQKVAKQKLGDLYGRDFAQVFHQPPGNEPWFWDKLDDEEEEYMMRVEKADMMRLEKAQLGID